MLLQLLNILEGFDIRALGQETAAYYDLLARALVMIFAERRRFAEPGAGPALFTELTSKAHAAELRRRIGEVPRRPAQAPSGLAGLILMHGPIVRSGAFASVLRAYAIALVPAVVMVLGAVLLIEMSYRVATQPELGTRMRLLWITVDAATPWPWLASIGVAIAGFATFRSTWPIVAAAWRRATLETKPPPASR